jgi:hypothetical protein
MVQFVDKLHPVQSCNPPNQNPAATVQPMPDQQVKYLVSVGVLGVHQVDTAIQELKAEGKDVSILAAEFPSTPPDTGADTTTSGAVNPPAATGGAQAGQPQWGSGG